MRRFLIAWLVVSILGYGIVVAADVHVELSADHTHIIGDNTSNSADIDDTAGCDHCCHGISHLLGLNGSHAKMLTADCSHLSVPYTISLISFSPTLAFRPPITI